ncbi:DUF4396 domain-containing protein [Bradyrhizobium sp.]|uniref:DUF4396 domain-containing protein n=1 Tax=Bradyrhizobium sp. TaxID=376 RepID=UPI003C6109B9
MLHDLAIASLLLAAASAMIIAGDLIRHPQQMWIMDLVWPVTALFGSLAVICLYFTFGRATRAHPGAKPDEQPAPFAIMVTKGTLHCGAGCMLGDLCAEWLAFAAPGVAVWAGWQWLFGEKMFAVWVLDYAFAYVLGVLFQYFTIAPMRGLSFRDGLIAAVKADTISITAWQIGMYGFMAAARFYIFPHSPRMTSQTDSAEFWFMMQIAMILGFFTAYPANWWLLRIGVKERM